LEGVLSRRVTHQNKYFSTAIFDDRMRITRVLFLKTSATAKISQ
jgi:hypothetical protein